MKTLLIITLFFVPLFSIFSQDTVVFKGKFWESKFSNDKLYAKSSIDDINNRLNKIDFNKIEIWFNLQMTGFQGEINENTNQDSLWEIRESNIIKADSIIESDSLLTQIYRNNYGLGEITDVICLNEIRKQGLLGYYNIILNSFIPGTTNIFMTKEQYEKIKPNLDKEMELKAIFISEEKRAKFKIYKLVE